MDAGVRAWLTALFRVMHRKCFDHGALVVDITGCTPLQAFLRRLAAASHPRPIARTHRLFMSPKLFAGRRMCARTGSACNAHVVQPTSRQMEYVLNPKLQGLCGPASKNKGVLLFYTFLHGKRAYLYLKLEEARGMTVSHAISAFRTYVLRMHEGRREAHRCERDASLKGLGDKVTRDTAHSLRAAQALGLSADRALKACRYYDAQVRVGREMFMPGSIAQALLPSPKVVTSQGIVAVYAIPTRLRHTSTSR